MGKVNLLCKITVILIAICPISYLQAKNFVPSFETTRLKSTAGAGVATPLLDEANFLNPASSAFFNIGSVYVQKNDFTNQVDSPGTAPIETEANQLGIIASDSKGRTGGSLSYNKMTLGQDEYKKIGASLSSPAGEKSALGASFNHVTEKVADENNIIQERKYKVSTFGVTHAISQNLFLGLVLQDAFRAMENNTRAIVGLHYFYKSFINLIVDVGADYNGALSETARVNVATEVKILNDFMLRFGVFDDKGLAIKGSGIGIGWVQPKLTFEIALKNTDILEEVRLGQESGSLKETTLSLSYRF